MTRSERLGLLMIASSLVVILVITGLLFQYERQTRRQQIRAQGVSLARLLASIPYDQLVSQHAQQGVLQTLRFSQETSGFAYSVVVDPRGQPVVQVTAPETVVPPLPLTASLWLQERPAPAPAPGGGPLFRDFCVPILSDGQVAGYLRVGYLEPGYALGLQQMPLFAAVALPVFLLTPLFYFGLRREIRPLTEATAQLQRGLEDGWFHLGALRLHTPEAFVRVT
ncbi:MAG: hypothetical protein HY900_13760, partial [Deltaproteobacteria bacterium]|nr:hypothetical protein [Deltaproteobacteria bacterium]